MKRTTIISVINHKGGVGKTTSTVNLAAGLAREGRRVLVVDLDTQMNLTHSLIGELSEDEPNVSECILDKKVSLRSVIRKTHTENLDIAPSGESMVDLDLQLQAAMGREGLLKRALDGVKGDYDYILLDNPPHLGLTTINSLAASDYFVVPVSTEYLPMVGIKHLLGTIENVKVLNESLKNLGYLLTMVDRRESIAGDVENILRGSFKEQVFKSLIRVNTKLKACPQQQHTIFDAESGKGKGSSDYAAVTKEIINRVEKNQWR